MRIVLPRYVKFLVFLIIVSADNTLAQTPHALWAKSITAPHIQAKDVQTDAAGNSYITGSFQGTITLNPGDTNPTQLASTGSDDIYVAKYNSSGNLLWAFKLGESASDMGTALVVDPSGMLYLSGTFNKTMDIDPSSKTFMVASAGSTDIFVAKYNGNVNPADASFFQWGFAVGGAGNDSPTGLTLDANGMIYIIGRVLSTSFDADPSSNDNTVSGPDGLFKTFVAKYNGNLAADNTAFYQWAFLLSGSGDVLSNSIAVDATGNVIITGRFFGATMNCDPGKNTNTLSKAAGQYDIFIAKYNGNLLPDNISFSQWAFVMGTPGTDEATNIALDATGMLYVTGYIPSGGSMNIDPSSKANTLTSAFGNSDLFVIKYNTKLAPTNASFYQWGFVLGSAGQDQPTGIAIDSSGNLYLAAWIGGSMNADPGSQTHSVTTNGTGLFYAKYNGNLLPSNTSFYKSAFTIGGTSSAERMSGISIDNNGMFTVCGIFSGANVDFNPQRGSSLHLSSDNSGSNSSGFLARYSPPVAPTIGVIANMVKTYGNAAFALTNPSSNSVGAFSYSSSNTSVATLSGNILTIIGTGNAVITAAQPADGNYSAGSTSFTLTVNPPVGPVNINNGIAMWLDASDIDADGNSANDPANNSSLVIWKDKSGLAHNATTFSGQNNIAFVTNQINGKPVAHFTRVNDVLGSVLVATGVDIRAAANPAVTIFTVYKPGSHATGGGQGQALWGNDNGNRNRFFYTSWNSTDDGIVSRGPVNPTNIEIMGAGVTNALRSMTTVYNNGVADGSAIYFNGAIVTQFTDNTDPSAAQSDFRIGWDGDKGAFNGDIAEMIVYNRKLTDCEIQQINQYLGTKYDAAFTNAAITTSAQTTICENTSLTLSASAGSNYQWYKDGVMIQSATAPTYSAAVSGTYTVAIAHSGCSVVATSLGTVVRVNPLPTISRVTGTTTICSGNTTTLTASAAATNPVFKWYDASAGGNVLFTGAAYTTPVLKSNTNYYIDITNNSGCTSGARTAVLVTVNQTPSAVTVRMVPAASEDLKVTVMPNPTTTYFTLKFESGYKIPLNLKVMDASGRVVDIKSEISANGTIQIGHNYSSGTYYAEILQDTKRKVVQLIKVRN